MVNTESYSLSIVQGFGRKLEETADAEDSPGAEVVVFGFYIPGHRGLLLVFFGVLLISLFYSCCVS